MKNENYIFLISSYDIDHLLPQVSKALEKRHEIISRERYPSMWLFIDRLNHSTHRKNRSRLRTKLFSIVCIAAGIFLLVPGLMEPQELLIPLLAGLTALIIGIFGLWHSRKNKKNPFDRSAKLLLAGKDTISEGTKITISFSNDGMTVSADDDNTVYVPFNDFECAVETADIFLFVYRENAMVLQKQDLITDNCKDFSDMISGKIKHFRQL